MKLKSVFLICIAIVCLILTYPFSIVMSQNSSPTVVVVPATGTGQIGETITVDVTINSVQNLYGIDLTLKWDNSFLEILNAESHLGVESHPNGVLHETVESPVNVVKDNASQSVGEYTLIVTSENPSPSFNGSGTVATLRFNTTKPGHTTIGIESYLADRPLPDETSTLIEHTDVNGTLELTIPEFPETMVLIMVATLITTLLIYQKRKHYKNYKPQN
jgi:hypothetical protein